MSGAALADRFLFRCGSQSPPPAFALQELPREKQWEANNERLRRVPARIRPAALRALPRPETFTQPSWAEPHSAPTPVYFEGEEARPYSVTCSAPQPRQNGAERSLALGGCIGKNTAKATKNKQKEPPENVKSMKRKLRK